MQQIVVGDPPTTLPVGELCATPHAAAWLGCGGPIEPIVALPPALGAMHVVVERTVGVLLHLASA
jgi:hypothetical protein